MSRHPDDEALAALALGDGTPDDAVHADSCVLCRAEVDSYVEAMARASAAGRVTLVAPPARVWDAIQAEIADDASGPDAARTVRVPERNSPAPGGGG